MLGLLSPSDLFEPAIKPKPGLLGLANPLHRDLSKGSAPLPRITKHRVILQIFVFAKLTCFYAFLLSFLVHRELEVLNVHQSFSKLSGNDFCNHLLSGGKALKGFESESFHRGSQLWGFPLMRKNNS